MVPFRHRGGLLTVKKVNQIKNAKYVFILLLGVVALNAANVTQVNRYATVENKPLTSQINPLLTVQQIHFPQSIHTVGEAIHYWMQYSGYSLVDESVQSQAFKEIKAQPLPQVVRSLGPLTVQDGLEVLAGQQVFSLIQDPLRRRINFKLKPQFAQAQIHSKGKRA
jgi:conjugative transfer region protein (TIGR03748 family)